MHKGIRKCLFCLDKIISYSLSSAQGAGEGNDNEGETSSKPPNFRMLCKLLEILITEDKLEQLKSYADDDKTCDSFLCLGCFDLVDKLRKLNLELDKIREEIGTTTSKIRSVIVNQKDILSASTAGVSDEGAGRRKRGRPKKDEFNSSESDGDFFRVFQKLVRESVDPSVADTILEGNPGRLDVGDSTESNGTSAQPRKKERKKTKRPVAVKKKCLDNIPDLPPEVDHRSLEDAANIKVEVHHSENVVEDEDFPFSDDLVIDAEFAVTKQELPCMDELVPTGEYKEDKLPVEDEARKSSRLRKPKRPAVISDSDDSSGNITPPKRKRKTKSKPVSKSNLEFICPHCDASFTRRLDYVAHKKNHTSLNTNSLPITRIYEEKDDKRIEIWLCSLCDHKEKGGRLRRYMEHMLSHENSAASSDLHSCDKCDKTFCIKLNLDLHKISRHDRRHIYLKCEFCENVDYKTQEDFITHLKTHLSEDAKVHICKSCAMAYSTLDKVLDHMKKHSSSKHLICPECPNEFSALKDLYQHCYQCHRELKKKFDCSHCNKSFLMEISLGVHLKQTHGIGDDSFGQLLSCSKCNNGKIFKSKICLDRHMLNMHSDSRPHKCPHCEMSFRFPSLLQVHVDERHMKIRYPCPHCPSSYSVATELTYHMRIHTGEGLYTCDQCGKQFPRPNQLKQHLLTHQAKNPETKFVCEVCGKEFANLPYLRKHKNSHKEKNLECQYCKMKFRRQDHLRGHLRTHTGDRPYICPNCAKGFNRRDILIVHMKMHGFSQEEASKAYDNYVNGLKQDSD